MREEDKPEIRTDREPIIKRFPDFPKTESLYWSAKDIGSRTVGPTSLELTIWATLEEEEFKTFVEGVVFENSTKVTPEFIPEKFNKAYNWEEITAQDVFDKKMLGKTQFTPTIYVDKDEKVLLIEAVGAN